MLIDPVVLLIAIQIIIESFPISSSGHMMLAEYAIDRLHLSALPVLPGYFDHFLHGPAIFITAAYFYRYWTRLIMLIVRSFFSLIRARFVIKRIRWSQRRLLFLVSKIVCFVIVADMATAAFYVVKKAGFSLIGIPGLAGGFILTGVLLLSERFAPTNTLNTLTGFRALILGITQGVALLLPGVSRFASTVVCARWVGISRRRSLQFSFLMFMPLMVAAFFLQALPAMVIHEQMATLLQPAFLLHYVVFTLVSYAGFTLSCNMFLRGTIWKFGWYMMLPALLALSLLFL
jgi:undecaprenyl-diphosphatase